MSYYLSDNIEAFRGAFGRDITDCEIRAEIQRLRAKIAYRQRLRATARQYKKDLAARRAQ